MSGLSFFMSVQAVLRRNYHLHKGRILTFQFSNSSLLTFQHSLKITLRRFWEVLKCGKLVLLLNKNTKLSVIRTK